jgi:hypothetical protein
MLVIVDNDDYVHAECNHCGARQPFRRFTSRAAGGGVRREPEEGQWLHCRVCGDWSQLEYPTGSESSATLASRR